MADIYLDNNATTACDLAVVDAMLPYFTEQFGNPSSIHRYADGVAKGIAKARRQIQALLGAQHDSEIIFTACGTESDNTAILSALKCYPNRKEIITTTVEHPAVLNLCKQLEKEDYTVHYLKVDGKGRLDMEEYRSLLTPNVAIVSVMWANNETGTLFPVVEMAELANAAGVQFHTDAVQAVGKVAMDLKATKIDMLSLSGHKLHAPKGIGVLYLKRGSRFRPLLRGGHQERGRRAGTENAASIVGLGVACEQAMQHMTYENTHVKALRDRLEAGILRRCPTLSSPATRTTACPTPPTSLSSTWKAKRSLCCSTSRASRHRPARPAPRDRWSRPTSCAPWTFPTRRRTARSVFRCRATTPRKKSTG